MKKIGYGQLIAILVLVRAFSLITSTGSYCIEKMIGVAISIIFQIAVTLPILSVYKKQGFDIKQNMVLGRLGFTIYGIFFILWGALSLVNLWNVTQVIYLPIGNKVLGALLVAIVGLYGAYLGLRAVGRSAVLGMIFMGLAVLVMVIGAYNKVDISNITVMENPKNILGYAVDDFFSSGELPALFLLLSLIENKYAKKTEMFLAVKFVFIEIVLFLGITVLGNLMSMSEYPFFAIGAYSQPFAIQRSDIIYMILFTILCIINITIQILLTALIIEEIFPKYKWKEVTATALMLISALIVNGLNIDIGFICGILILILAVIIPVIMMFTVKEKAVSK